MNPCIVIDTETTGLPNKPPGWKPRIIEIGAVVVTADHRLADTFQALVHQPEHHLRDPRGAPAWALADLTPELVLAQGAPASQVAQRLRRWVQQMAQVHQVRELRAFNQAFDFAFLRRSPWRLLDLLHEGRCIMLQSMAVMGAAGALPRWSSGRYKWPKATEAEAFFRARGHHVAAPGRPHRALHDALLEAHIAIAMDREGQQAQP